MAGEVEGLSGRLHWLFGAMAAQLVRSGEDAPEAADGEGAFEEYLLARMRVLKGYPDSDFAKLMVLYLEGRDKLHHFFALEFTNDGIAAMPKGGAASNLPPARFPFSSCVSRFALQLGGKHEESGI
jgi:hypothetical protein